MVVHNLPAYTPLWRLLWHTVQEDPRFYQIAILGFLVLYSSHSLDFALAIPQVFLLLGTSLLTQCVASHWTRLPTYDPRSALISGLSLCLLLRTNSLLLTILTAVLSIASKFVLRWRGKHLFNPTNFGLVVMMLSTEAVWVSPGQWGNAAIFALLLLGLGTLVVYRSTRSDVTYAFLGLYSVLHIGRALWLGDPLSIPLHHLSNGSLLLFAFLMISDPKTTPDSRTGRVLFALCITLAAGYGQFVLYQSTALFWALAVSALMVPGFDWLWPGPRYRWPARRRCYSASSRRND